MDNDGIDEFMNQARGLMDEIAHSAPQKVRRALSTVDDKDDEPKKPKSAITQYADVGIGFLPTSDTVKKLPADCYTVALTPGGDNVVYLPQKLITDNLLRLPDSRSDEVVNEVKHFWTLKERFKKFGFAHKRGFMLWGPPGSGKTSTASIIINDMVKSGGIVILGEYPGAVKLALKNFRKIESERPLVVVLEDLDSIIHHYGESEVLSILDGEAQVENVVFIATTNYPEKLDGRIINRPSRFDRIVKIGMPNADARALYLKTKIETTVVDGIDLVKETDGLSIAHLKELIVSVMCQENPVSATLDRLKGMKKRVSSETDSSGPLGL